MPTAQLLWYKAPTDVAPGKAAPFIAELLNMGPDDWAPGQIALGVRLSDTQTENIISFPVTVAVPAFSSVIVGGDVPYPDEVIYGWLFQLSLYENGSRVQDFGGTITSSDPDRPGPRRDEAPPGVVYLNQWTEGDNMQPPPRQVIDARAKAAQAVLMNYPEDGIPAGASAWGTDHAITGTDRQDIYKSEVFGDFQIHLEGQQGQRTLRLHFAEIATPPGRRVFDVFLDGTPILQALDVEAKAGGKFRALVEEFAVVLGDSSVLSFRGREDRPILSALEIVPA